MKYVVLVSFLVALFGAEYVGANEQNRTPEEEQAMAEIQAFWNSLDRQRGEVRLPNGVATLSVPESFYYLNPEDTEKVLVDVWGNPPGAGLETLGMLFSSGVTPFDDGSWAVTVEYEEDGYVSDEDADEIDYDELLSQMKEGAAESSRQRVEQGYEPIELVGWAAKPFYDEEAHKLHWAKEIKFGDQEKHTLNYNIRILGRKGVLNLNFIADMDQKSLIETEKETVLTLANFDQGSRYEDFDPSIDQVAAYGIGALVAGKVIAKTGLIAAGIIFLKKFGVLAIIAIGALFAKLFRSKSV